MDMLNEEVRLVPVGDRIPQHLHRVLAHIVESLSFNLAFPRQDLCPEQLDQTFLAISEIILTRRQLFMRDQDSETRSRQVQTRRVHQKRPLLGQRVKVILAMKFLYPAEENVLDIVSEREFCVFI